MKSTPKAAPKMVKATKVMKDGYGAHWHAVGWLAAIALVLSASTMTLSASAQSRITVTPTLIYRAIGDVKTQMNRIEAKLDGLATQCGSTTPGTCEPTSALPEKALTTQPTEPAPVPVSDVTRCRMTCEDEFNACAKAAKTDTEYSACKLPYEACFNKCGQ